MLFTWVSPQRVLLAYATVFSRVCLVHSDRSISRVCVCVCVLPSVSKSLAQFTMQAGGSDRVCGITANEDVHILW